MKSVIRILVIIVLSFSGVWLGKKIVQTYKHKKVTEQKIQALPHACFESLAGKTICIDEFNSEKPLVLVYFHPECEHCQYEAQEIGQNAATFSNCQLVMITHDDSLQRVKSFCETNHLWEVDNIEVLIDTANQFKTVFGKAVIPSVYIYGTDRKLKKQYLGETRIDLILAEISAIN